MVISEEAAAVLRAESQALWAQRGEIDRAIAAIELVLNGAEPLPVTSGTSSTLQIAAEKPARRRRGAGERYDWAKGRRLWEEGKTVNEIAKVLGCALSSVKNHAYKQWPRRSKTSSGRCNPNKGLPKGYVKIGLTKCPNCGKITSLNPCEMCHVKIAAGLIGVM